MIHTNVIFPLQCNCSYLCKIFTYWCHIHWETHNYGICRANCFDLIYLLYIKPTIFNYTNVSINVSCQKHQFFVKYDMIMWNKIILLLFPDQAQIDHVQRWTLKSLQGKWSRNIDGCSCVLARSFIWDIYFYNLYDFDGYNNLLIILKPFLIN